MVCTCTTSTGALGTRGSANRYGRVGTDSEGTSPGRRRHRDSGPGQCSATRCPAARSSATVVPTEVATPSGLVRWLSLTWAIRTLPSSPARAPPAVPSAPGGETVGVPGPVLLHYPLATTKGETLWS
ncbi:hypothetical protein ONO86_04367 [Micromonospora noduli]|nr:hypothetical protein ONO86_04367 [Micromonospora noduli]